MKRREFLSAGAAVAAAISLGIEHPMTAFAQREIKRSKATTKKLFKAPGMYPNGLAVAPEGLWIAQQKLTADITQKWGMPFAADRDEAAWLVNWKGKLLKTVMTHSRNTSGMAYGDNCVWMGANADPEGIYQVDVTSGKEISHRQIPRSKPTGDGGGCHGAQWHDGKLWIVANEMAANLRVDPNTGTPDLVIPIYHTAEMPRWHDITFDQDGNMWQVIGNNSKSYAEGKPGLVKYDSANGQVLEIVEFVPGSCDPHGLEFHDGKLISCDAGEHPGWKPMDSPTAGWIFSIEVA